MFVDRPMVAAKVVQCYLVLRSVAHSTLDETVKNKFNLGAVRTMNARLAFAWEVIEPDSV